MGIKKSPSDLQIWIQPYFQRLILSQRTIMRHRQKSIGWVEFESNLSRRLWVAESSFYLNDHLFPVADVYADHSRSAIVEAKPWSVWIHRRYR